MTHRRRWTLGGLSCTAARRRGAWLPMLVTAWALGACSTAQPPLRLHSLVGSDSAFAAAAAAPGLTGDPLRLVIAPIRVPAAIDRPQWLVRRADDSLQLLEEDRWASPFADELKAALRARLASRWQVVDGTLPTAGTDAAPAPAWRLVLEVLRLDARPTVDVQLEARWSLVPPQSRGGDATCSLRLVEPVDGQGTLPIAAAYRRASVRLADQIGAQLRGPGGNRATPGCPATQAPA